MRVALEEAVETLVARQAFAELEPADRFSHVLATITQEIKELYPETTIAIVSGIISSEGDHRIEQNIQRLIQWRTKINHALLKQGIRLPTLVSPFIFTELLYEEVGAFTLQREEREAHFQAFYREFLGSGLVSHIFMTPGYECSAGALDELATARTQGLAVHYVSELDPIGGLKGVMC